MTKNTYRLDVQGLRAVSVLLVFFAHAGWGSFSGGFIGVDVFFVISGYVISLLLMKEYQRHSTIVLHKFYARRLQRLFPALLFVTTVTLAVAFMVISPAEQQFQYNSAISANLWLSNMFFIDFDVNYFTLSASENLFLHTWSLGVEEQFYLLWPFLLLLGLKYLTKPNKNGLLIYLLVIITCSIILQAYFTSQASNLAFYLMPARVWQFALGALVAILHFRGSNFFTQINSSLVFELSAILGLVFILFAAMMFDNSTPYPNWQVFIPSIGTALILLPKHSLVEKLLSIKPLVFLGNISYSLYLWHWLLLWLSRELVVYLPFYNTVFALVLTIVLSVFTYYIVEQPIRKNNTLLKRPKITIYLILGVMLLSVLAIIELKSYSTNIFNNDKELQRFEAVRRKLPIIYAQGCDTWYASDEVEICKYGNEDSKNKVVIFGDSILLQWFPAFLYHYKSIDWQILVLTKSGCPIINRPFFYHRIKSVYNTCDNWKKSAIDKIKIINPQVVIIGNSTGYPFVKEEWQNGTKEIIDELLPFTKKIFLFAGTPKLGFDGPMCLSKQYWQTKLFANETKLLCNNQMLTNKAWQWQKELVADYKNVKYIELSSLVCPNGLCQAERDNVIVYRDEMHLTTEFVDSLKDIISAKLSKSE